MNKFKHLREKAVKLRENGESLNQICKMLNRPKGTVLYWIKDVEIKKTNIFLHNALERNKLSCIKAGQTVRKKFLKIHRKAKEQAKQEWHEGLKDNEEFKLFLMLYWCEGHKKAKHTLGIANSDSSLIFLGKKWFNKINYHNKKLLYTIQLHIDQDEEEVLNYWKDLLNISEIKVTRKSNSGKMSGRRWNSKYGVLTVLIHDAYLKTKLDYWISQLENSLF